MITIFMFSPKIQFLIIYSIMSFILYINHSIELIFSITGKTLIVFIVSYFMTIFMRKYRTKETVITSGKAVLITGCDSGFGHRLALRLNENGFRVYATVHCKSNAGANELIKNAVFVDKMHVLEMDVTNDKGVQYTYNQVNKDLDSNGDKLWALVNNAGRLMIGHIEWGTMDEIRKLFEVNMFGVLRVTRMFLPLIKSSKGRVVNVVSLSGRFTADNLGIYCMSKHSLISFSDALRREMVGFGVRVSTIEPGWFQTRMNNISNMKDVLTQTWNQSEDSVKKSYGFEYFEIQKQLINSMEKGVKLGLNIDLVVNDMIDAIENTEPQLTYQPIEGLLSKILSLIPVYIPTEWYDYFLSSMKKSLIGERDGKF